MNMRGEEHKFLCNYVIYIIIEIHLYLLYRVIFFFFAHLTGVHEFRFSILSANLETILQA